MLINASHDINIWDLAYLDHLSRKHDLFGHLIMQNINIGYSIPACAILSHPRTYLSKQKHQYGMAIGFYYVPIPKP